MDEIIKLHTMRRMFLVLGIVIRAVGVTVMRFSASKLWVCFLVLLAIGDAVFCYGLFAPRFRPLWKNKKPKVPSNAVLALIAYGVFMVTAALGMLLNESNLPTFLGHCIISLNANVMFLIVPTVVFLKVFDAQYNHVDTPPRPPVVWQPASELLKRRRILFIIGLGARILGGSIALIGYDDVPALIFVNLVLFFGGDALLLIALFDSKFKQVWNERPVNYVLWVITLFALMFVFFVCASMIFPARLNPVVKVFVTIIFAAAMYSFFPLLITVVTLDAQYKKAVKPVVSSYSPPVSYPYPLKNTTPAPRKVVEPPRMSMVDCIKVLNERHALLSDKYSLYIPLFFDWRCRMETTDKRNRRASLSPEAILKELSTKSISDVEILDGVFSFLNAFFCNATEQASAHEVKMKRLFLGIRDREPVYASISVSNTPLDYVHTKSATALYTLEFSKTGMPICFKDTMPLFTSREYAEAAVKQVAGQHVFSEYVSVREIPASESGMYFAVYHNAGYVYAMVDRMVKLPLETICTASSDAVARIECAGDLCNLAIQTTQLKYSEMDKKGKNYEHKMPFLMSEMYSMLQKDYVLVLCDPADTSTAIPFYKAQADCGNYYPIFTDAYAIHCFDGEPRQWMSKRFDLLKKEVEQSANFEGFVINPGRENCQISMKDIEEYT